MWHLRRRYGPYNWTRVSSEFYRLLKQSATKGGRIMEFGSSTGHISFRLAREGYAVTLLDIRPGPIAEAREIFVAAEVSARFVVENFLDHRDSYDLLWNSGLIQCLTPAEREAFFAHAAAISPRLLLFYPDTGTSSGKDCGKNLSQIPGVGDAMEYLVHDLPECFSRHYAQVYWGRIPGKKLALPFDMYWLQGDNPCASV